MNRILEEDDDEQSFVQQQQQQQHIILSDSTIPYVIEEEDDDEDMEDDNDPDTDNKNQYNSNNTKNQDDIMYNLLFHNSTDSLPPVNNTMNCSFTNIVTPVIGNSSKQRRQQMQQQQQQQQQQQYDDENLETPIIRNSTTTSLRDRNNILLQNESTTTTSSTSLVVTPIIRNTSTNKYGRTSTKTGINNNNTNRYNNNNNNNSNTNQQQQQQQLQQLDNYSCSYNNEDNIESETPIVNNRTKYINNINKNTNNSYSRPIIPTELPGTRINDTTGTTSTTTNTRSTSTTNTNSSTNTITPPPPIRQTTNNNNNNNNRQIAKFAAKINHKHTNNNNSNTNTNTKFRSSNNKTTTTTNIIQSIVNVVQPTTTETTTITLQKQAPPQQQQQQQQQPPQTQILKKRVQNNNNNNSDNVVTISSNSSQPVDFDISIDDLDFDISNLCDYMEEDEDYNNNENNTRIDHPNEKQEEPIISNTCRRRRSIPVDFDISADDIDFDLSCVTTTSHQYDINDFSISNNNNTDGDNTILIVQDIAAAAAAAAAAVVTATLKNSNISIEVQQQQQQQYQLEIEGDDDEAVQQQQQQQQQQPKCSSTNSCSTEQLLSSPISLVSGEFNNDNTDTTTTETILQVQQQELAIIVSSPVVSTNQPTILVSFDNIHTTNLTELNDTIEASSPVSINQCSSIVRGDFDNAQSIVVNDKKATPVSPASIKQASSIVSGEFNQNDIATTISSITTTATASKKEPPASIAPVLPVVGNKIISGDYHKRDTTNLSNVIKSTKATTAKAALEIVNDTQQINNYDSSSESSTEVNLDDDDSKIDSIMINNSTKRGNANALQWQQQQQKLLQLQQHEEEEHPIQAVLHQQLQQEQHQQPQQEDAMEEPKPNIRHLFGQRQQGDETLQQEVVHIQSQPVTWQQQQQQQQLQRKAHNISQSTTQQNMLHEQRHEEHLHVPVLPQHLRPIEPHQKQQPHINLIQTLQQQQQQQQPHEHLNIDPQKVFHLQQPKEPHKQSFPSYESLDSSDLWYPEPIRIIEANCFDGIHEQKQEEDHIEHNQLSLFTGRDTNHYHTDINSVSDEDVDNNNEAHNFVETSTTASAETNRISSPRSTKKLTTIRAIVAPSNWMNKNGRLIFRSNRSITQPDDIQNSNSSNQHIKITDPEMSRDDDVHISRSKVSSSGQSKQYHVDNNDDDANYDNICNNTMKYSENLYKHNRLKLLLIVLLLLLIPLVMTVIYTSITYRSNANTTSNSTSTPEYELLRYQDSANTIVQIVQSKLLMLRQSMESLAYQTAYYGGVSVSLPGSYSSRWPFVTVENFRDQSQYVQTIAEYPIVFFNPIITSAITRRTWEIYSIPKISTEQTPLPFNQIWGRIANGTESTIANTTSNPETGSPTTLRMTSNYTYGPIPKGSIGPFHPIYQIYEGDARPPIQTRRVLKNGLRYSYTNNKHDEIRRSQQKVSGNSSMILFDMMTASGYPQFFNNVIQQYNRGFISDLLSLELYRIKYNVGIFEPLSLVTEPIFPTIDNRTSTSSPIVGTINTILQWKSLFVDILGTEQVPVHSYIQNTCGDQFTYTITGPSVAFDGYSPKDHFVNYTDIAITTSLADQSDPSLVANGNTSTSLCLYTMTIYPLFRNSSINDSNSGTYQENKTLSFMLGVGLPLLLLVLAWIMYDYCAYNRKIRNMHSGSDRFDQLFAPVNTASANINVANNRHEQFPIINLKEFIQRKMTEESSISIPDNIPREPLADHYANATILTANLVGFYAWASEFEPSKVFLFLEELQRSFETIAKVRRICIVDSFVGETSSCIAVSGILGQDTEHAITMIRFARDMQQQTIPFDTDQSLRLGTRLKIGIHSGSITAGVVRQDREHRLRLFGDAVAVASSLEQSGEVDKIHCGTETAIALAAAGKGHWAIPRPEQILVTDKEMMQTFWVELSADEDLENKVNSEGVITTRQPAGHISENFTNNEKKDDTGSPTEFPDDISQQNTKTKRLIDWNVHLLKKLLKNIVSSRIEQHDIKEGGKINAWLDGSYAFETLPLEEIQDYIKFPPIEEGTKTPGIDMLSKSVVAQLHDYVTNIALFYNENPFHNFEHTSHVVLSVSNLLSKLHPSESNPYINRIVADPLTQFACILAALIHDADHPGVSNEQLNKEGESITEFYGGRSTAEQNSIDLCWDLLLKESYAELRSALCQSNSELCRFRGLLLNTALATDLWNDELSTIRNSRWNAIFYRSSDDERTPDELEKESNQKCTALLEIIVQSADIAHTMQDWNVYLKWNQQSFEECYVAYRAGRAEDLPSLTWYTNELDFFNGFVIPIAQKLKDSYAFGSHGESFVHGAISNRDRWAIEGNDIVRTMLEHLVLNDSVEVIDFQPSYDEQTNTPTDTDCIKGGRRSSSSSNHMVPDDDKTNSVVSVRSVWSYHAAKADARAAAVLARKK